MPETLEQLITKRRSIYNLGSRQILSREQIAALVKDALKYCPTAFNSQSGRAVLLFDSSHYKLWETTAAELAKVTPPERFPQTRVKIDSFAAGMGTVLYFIDDETTLELQKQFPLYADRFPIWAEQAAGILQYIVWTLFAEHQVGASLQHYNPLIDEQIREAFHIPASWRLVAQMPFGSIEAPAAPKTFLPIEERFQIFT